MKLNNFCSLFSYKEMENRRESIMFSVGFSPKQRKGRRKPLTSKSTTDKNKSVKSTTPQRRQKTPKKKTPKQKVTDMKKSGKTPGKKRVSYAKKNTS